MKKFIYVLSLPKSGTTILAKALRKIGIDAHHELIDIRPIYLKWIKNRFTSNSSSSQNVMDIDTAKTLWKDTLLKYGIDERNEYFADISHYLSTIYPIVDNICKDENIDVCSVYLTRNYYPHRIRSFKDPNNYIYRPIRIEDGTNHIYNSSYTYRDVYYPAELSWCSDIKWEDWVNMSGFERLCWYWKYYNQYFLEGGRKIFHVEDFNTRSLELLKILYPEATEKQKEIFKRELFYIPDPPDKAGPVYTLDMTNEEKEIYDRICGSTLKKLGY